VPAVYRALAAEAAAGVPAEIAAPVQVKMGIGPSAGAALQGPPPRSAAWAEPTAPSTAAAMPASNIGAPETVSRTKAVSR
jgi:hypothetical protein